MTLIATAISRYGIVQAADAGLTAHPRQISAGRRIFPVAFTAAALSVTGSYSLNGKPLDLWMTREIEDYQRSTDDPTLRGLAEHLRDRLTPQRAPVHRRMIHLAGYATDGDRAHPEMYFVRNFRGSSPLGYYDEPGAEFFVSEEFWSRDYRSEQNRETVASGGAHLYLNGSPKTRIAYLVLNQRLHDFYRQTWAASKRFRSPRTLQELATLIEIDMRLTSAFLGSIGKKVNADPAQIEMELIPAPSGALQL